MAIFIINGFPGAGKGIIAMGRMTDYVRAGRHVATNMDINVRRMAGRNSKKCRVTRIPDYPCWADFDNLPCPNHTHDDSKNGGIFLDESVLFLNSHDYRDKTIRPGLLKFLIMSRHLRWDVYLLIQDPESLDGQVRRACGEHHVYCMRTDRLPIPYIGWLISILFGQLIPIPKIHIGTVRYGRGASSTFQELWTYRGPQFYMMYDTHQKFDPDFNSYQYNKVGGWAGNAGHCYLPPGRINYGQTIWTFKKKMKLTKIVFRKWNRLLVFCAGFVSVMIYFLMYPPVQYVETNATAVVWQSLAQMARINKLSDQRIVYVDRSTGSFIDTSVSVVDLSGQPDPCQSYVIVGEEKRCIKSLPSDKSVIIDL
jgi:hypothetical protein